MSSTKLHKVEIEFIEYFNKREIASKEKTTIEKLIMFFQIYDKMELTNHVEIIYSLYKVKAISLNKICKTNHVNQKTLYRYRIKYIKVYNIIEKL